MAEQILSQEEIDALLFSMDNGEVDLKTDEDQDEVDAKKIESYDLTSQSIMPREQFNALEEVHDRFTIFAQNSLATTLQKFIEIKIVSSEIVKYEKFLAAFSNPTILNIFSMEPLIGSALFLVEPDLAFSLIECMFGGEGQTLPEIREFSPIEKRMMGKFASDVLKNLEKAWKIVYPIKISLTSTETKPGFVYIAAPSDLMIINVFSIKWDEIEGNVHLCIPYLMLDSIKEKLSATYLLGKNIENAWRSQLQELLRDANVTVTGELGRSLCTIGDLLNFETDDVIILNTGPDDPISVNVEGVPAYYGFPGIVKGNRAVQITALLEKDGENK